LQSLPIPRISCIDIPTDLPIHQIKGFNHFLSISSQVKYSGIKTNSTRGVIRFLDIYNFTRSLSTAFICLVFSLRVLLIWVCAYPLSRSSRIQSRLFVCKTPAPSNSFSVQLNNKIRQKTNMSSHTYLLIVKFSHLLSGRYITNTAAR
jgi:hypothetical protein